MAYNFHFESKVYGHLFTQDQTGTFISIIDQVQTELGLVASNLNSNNVSLAENHASKASSLLPRVMGEIGEDSPQLVGELMRSVFNMENLSSTSGSKTQNLTEIVNNLNQKLENAKIIRIAQVQPGYNPLEKVTNLLRGVFGGNAEEQSNEQVNSRIQALAFAELTDDVLKDYGKAYNVGFDMTNMSNMVMVDNKGTTNSMNMSNTASSNKSNMNISMNSMHNSSGSVAQHMDNVNNDYKLVQVADYQSAQALAKKGLQFFNTDLRNMALINKTVFLTKLHNGLNHLNNSIDNKASPVDIMMIVHSEVHPNLMEAFGLQLRK